MLKHKFSGKRRAYIVTMRALMTLAALLTAALVLFMIGYVLYKGLPNVTWKLLSTKPSYLTNSIGILPDILNTLYIVLASLVYVLPLGVGAAIYLTEYASNKKLVAAIEYAAETLSGIPSIIYGLVGMLFFCRFLGMQTSLMAGALTLVIMNLLINRARKRGEHFELHPLDPRYDSTGSKPKLIVALIPMAVLFLLFNIWKLNINICLLCSIALSLVLFWPQLRRRDLKAMLNSGAVDSVPMTMTVAAICGFAGVITNTDAFQSMITAITSISIAPILICWVVVALMCMITGGPAPAPGPNHPPRMNRPPGRRITCWHIWRRGGCACTLPAGRASGSCSSSRRRRSRGSKPSSANCTGPGGGRPWWRCSSAGTKRRSA